MFCAGLPYRNIQIDCWGAAPHAREHHFDARLPSFGGAASIGVAQAEMTDTHVVSALKNKRGLRQQRSKAFPLCFGGPGVILPP